MVETLLRWFQEGGLWSYLILLVDVTVMLPLVPCVLVLAVVRSGPTAAWIARHRTLLALGAFALGSVPALTGLVGWQAGLQLVQEAVAAAAPDAREALEAQGREVAASPLWLGLLSSAPAWLAAVGFAAFGVRTVAEPPA